MNTPTRLSSVFLSHSHVDKEFALRLARDLCSAGAQVWVDEVEILVGDSLIDKIRSGIDRMEYLAVIVSPASVHSEWVKREVDVAMNSEIEGRSIKVLPLLYRPCQLPGFLKGKYYLDFTSDERYSESLSKLIQRLKKPSREFEKSTVTPEVTREPAPPITAKRQSPHSQSSPRRWRPSVFQFFVVITLCALMLLPWQAMYPIEAYPLTASLLLAIFVLFIARFVDRLVADSKARTAVVGRTIENCADMASYLAYEMMSEIPGNENCTDDFLTHVDHNQFLTDSLLRSTAMRYLAMKDNWTRDVCDEARRLVRAYGVAADRLRTLQQVGDQKMVRQGLLEIASELHKTASSLQNLVASKTGKRSKRSENPNVRALAA